MIINNLEIISLLLYTIRMSILPRVYDITNDNDELTFHVDNLNVSYINAVRRTIIKDIPCVVLKSAPYNESNVLFRKNTTRLNNDILKHRLSSIPIHITSTEINLEDYQLEIRVRNDSDIMQYVTTKDFKIKNIKTNTYLNENEVSKIFPPNKQTGDHILFARLRPAFQNAVQGEELDVIGNFTLARCGDDYCYNMTSTCAYEFKQDKVAQERVWMNVENDLKSKGETREFIEEYKENWLIHDAQRVYSENSFIFHLETIGVFSNESLIKQSCSILKQRLDNIISTSQSGGFEIKKDIDMEYPNSFIVNLGDEDFTIGQILSRQMYEDFFDSGEILYISFLKKHPHDIETYLKISIKENNPSRIIQMIQESCSNANTIINSFKDYF